MQSSSLVGSEISTANAAALSSAVATASAAAFSTIKKPLNNSPIIRGIAFENFFDHAIASSSVNIAQSSDSSSNHSYATNEANNSQQCAGTANSTIRLSNDKQLQAYQTFLYQQQQQIMLRRQQSEQEQLKMQLHQQNMDQQLKNHIKRIKSAQAAAASVAVSSSPTLQQQQVNANNTNSLQTNVETECGGFQRHAGQTMVANSSGSAELASNRSVYRTLFSDLNSCIYIYTPNNTNLVGSILILTL